jgi:hypothetical protein
MKIENKYYKKSSNGLVEYITEKVEDDIIYLTKANKMNDMSESINIKLSMETLNTLVGKGEFLIDLND